jgi:hypothetical protein
MHAVWCLLLDAEFMHAYIHGIVIECFDGVLRRFFQDRQLVTTKPTFRAEQFKRTKPCLSQSQARGSLSRIYMVNTPLHILASYIA